MKISLFFLLLILMQGWLILSTAIQLGDLRTSIIGHLLPILVVGFLVEDMLNDMDDFINGVPIPLLKILLICMPIYGFLRVVGIIICSAGCYFLLLLLLHNPYVGDIVQVVKKQFGENDSDTRG